MGYSVSFLINGLLIISAGTREFSRITCDFFRSYKQRFYIRSRSDPTLFWWETGFTTGHQIIASRQGRTKFRVQIKGKGHHDGQVMIGSDDIHISPILRPNFFVSSTESSGLVLGKKADTYAFSDFKGGFTIDAKDSNSEEIGNFYVLQSDQGDEWELVA